MTNTDQHIADLIRTLAGARNITLSHLPDRAGVSRSHFWDVMGGRKSPTLKWLEQVAAALECEVDLNLIPSKRAGPLEYPK